MTLRARLLALTALLGACGSVCARSGAAAPPATDKAPVTDVMHGQQIVDPYRWLEPLESESEAVEEWTTAQNEYTRNILDRWPGRHGLENRLAELMTIGAVGTPMARGPLLFYPERQGDQNQPVLYVREGSDGEPRVLVDPNALDERGLYALDWYAPSEDGRLLAFGLSHAGDEMSVLHVLEVRTGQWLPDEISGKVDFAGWAPDQKSFLYGKLEDPDDAYSRSFRFHVIGRHHRHDPLLIQQENPSRIPSAELSRDGRWIALQYFEGWSKQDVYVIDARAWLRTGEVTLTPIAVGLGARFSPVIMDGDTLYLFTTQDAPNGRLVAVNMARPDEEWRVIIPEKPDAVLRTVDHASDMLVAAYQKDVTSQYERFTMRGQSLGPIELPGLGAAGTSSGGAPRDGMATRHDSTVGFFAYESFNEPSSIYRVDLRTGQRSLWARPDVPVDPSSVVVRQEWCTSKDGTKVPMFIVHRRGLERSADSPCVIYGYGGFNVSLMPRFSATNFPWFEQGGVYVQATLRGGGEFGEAWHQAGMLSNKQNVYDDLYAVAEHLIAEGWTSPEHLAVMGGSNGGLLTGVAATQRPDLWAAAISAVPLLDMLRYQHLLMARFWIPEYGDPENPEHFAWLRAYSPYHNVKAGRHYPAILFTAGENDNRVHPMHARKMTALLQATASNDLEEDPILLWVDREGGHGQGKPLHLRIRDVADRWSFVMWQTGMNYVD